MRVHSILLYGLLLGTVAGCATNPVDGGRDFVLMSEDQELALGRQLHAEVLKQVRVYDDPRLAEYVTAITDKLGNRSHRANLYYRIQVLDSSQVNAFALPGGYLYITRGILAYMNSEAQLGGVIGHEIGHVTARHGVRQQAAAQGLGLLGLIITASARTRGVNDLTNVLGTALVRGYGREHELEADRLGAEYLARSGYDPEQMTAVVGILKNQELYEKQRAKEEGREASVYHGVFATHPDNDARLREVVAAAQGLQPDDVPATTPDSFLQRLDGMVFGSAAREGIQRGEHFYHRDLGIVLAFPQGWRLENRPDRLISSPADNSAILQLTSQDLNRKQSPETFLKKLHKDHLFEQGETVNTADFEGYTGTARLDTPFGRRRARVAAIFADRRAFVFSAVGKEEDGVDEDVFLNTIHSLRKLRPDEAALAEPMRLRIVKTRTGDTFSALATESALGHHAEEQLRLLNGMYPEGEPTPGQLIKIVE